jgi:hypothetical protein
MSGFFGLGWSKETLAFAFAWYWTLWSDGTRNHVRGVRLGCNARLEDEDAEVKACYGAIVRSKHPLLVGFERLKRHHNASVPSWPGTRNMPWKGSEHATIRAWLASHNLLAACEAYVEGDAT